MAPSRGAYVIFGHADGLRASTIELSALDGNNGFLI